MAVNRIRSDPIIVLDANALFLPFQFKLNLDSELKRLLGTYELVIPTCVFSELYGLSTSQKFGTLALSLAKKISQPEWYLAFEVELLKQHENVFDTKDTSKTDSIILRLAKALSAIVVTSDKLLLKLLRKSDIQTITLRARKYLVLNEKY